MKSRPSLARRTTALVASLVVGMSSATLLATAPAEAASAPVKIKVKYAKKVEVGKKVAFKGKVKVTSKRTRVVKLYVKSGKKWKLKAKKRTNRKGAFTLRAKVGSKAGRKTYRVVAPAARGVKYARVTKAIRVTEPASQVDTPKSAKVQLSWNRTTQNAGTNTFVGTGNVGGAYAGGREVVLQRRHADNWKTVARTTSAANGSFQVVAPASWLHHLRYRVLVKATSKSGVRYSAEKYLTSRPAWTPHGQESGHTLMRTPDGVRYRWNSCAGPIRYRVNLAQAPGGADLAMVQRAVADVALATGLTFQYRGATTAHGFPANGTPPRPGDADLVISWSKPGQTTAGFNDGTSGSVVGLGGVYGYYGSDARGKVVRVTQGDVAMRANYDWGGNTTKMFGVLKHEVSHSVGLGHAPEEQRYTDQVMYPFWGYQKTTNFGAGDLAGLKKLGATDGCVSTASSAGGALAAMVPGDGTTPPTEHVTQDGAPAPRMALP